MEKITKGAVKNGESRRGMAEAGGENQSFFCDICCRCSCLRIEGLWGWIWTSHNQKKPDVLDGAHILIGEQPLLRWRREISEDVMNLNCLCVGSSHYHSRV